MPVLSRDTTSGKKGHHLSQVKTPHNPLDSSAPLMKKGKQREVPKAKKPTSLKKVRGESRRWKTCGACRVCVTSYSPQRSRFWCSLACAQDACVILEE